MANQLTAAEIAAGQPTKEEIFEKIKANQEEFETNISNLQASSSKVDVFNLSYSGNMDDYDISDLNDRTPVFKAPSDFSIVQIQSTLLQASTSGTLEFTIERSDDDGQNWTAILTAPVELTGNAVGDTSAAPSFVVNGEQISQNDLLRITFTGQQVDQGDFQISVYGEA
jgi:hypothetical protein